MTLFEEKTIVKMFPISILQVRFTGTLIEKGGKIDIDKVLFRSGLCDPFPSKAQGKFLNLRLKVA